MINPEAAHAAMEKLTALVDAMRAVNLDTEARRILDEVLESTADGTGTDSADLADLVTVALAHAHVAMRRSAA